jgi:hypothetical protein
LATIVLGFAFIEHTLAIMQIMENSGDSNEWRFVKQHISFSIVLL